MISSPGALSSPYTAAMFQLFMSIVTGMSLRSLPSTINFDSFQSQADMSPEMRKTHAGNPRIHFRTYHPLL
ncbi:MAG: hypothetical protein J3Q66DRAFT_345924 [Benniella sp.]|nr:MAG: hypothetical protein J3Q66DRAFT_345924 [Benniella sp.]